MIQYYDVCPDTGEWVEKSADVLPGGKFRIIDGKWVRVGEAQAVPDEPWCNKTLDWNNGIVNPATGEAFKNKSAYLDSVKRSGHSVVGEGAASATTKKRDTVGDFDVRAELKKVTRQVLSKQ